jgi:hypothetical protein
VNPEPADQSGPSEIPPVSNAAPVSLPTILPPALPPVLPSPQKKGTPAAVIAICAAGGVLFLAVAAVAVALLTGAAGPVTRSAKPDRGVPASAAATPEASGNSEPGVTYRNERVPSEPWSIHILKIDRSRKELAFFAPHAKGKVLGVSLLADQARSVPSALGHAIAGVNGDFYLRDNPMYAGDPRGLHIVNGELMSAPDTVCTWFDSGNNPHLDEVKGDFKVTWADGKTSPFGFNERRGTNRLVLYTPSYGPSTRASSGRELVLEKQGEGSWLPIEAGATYRARVREIRNEGNSLLSAGSLVLSIPPNLLASLPELEIGAKLELSTATTPSMAGVKVAIGGGPALIRDGKPFSLRTPPPGSASDWSQRSKYERHPRAAVGWSATHVYLVIVDGRQPGLSSGMKLAELAEYLSQLGCTDAMNLDGGKSAQMWMNGRIMNSPCQGEDTVANSLLVLRKPDSR